MTSLPQFSMYLYSDKILIYISPSPYVRSPKGCLETDKK